MKLSWKRTLRTASSERFFAQRGGDDVAAVDLHYLEAMTKAFILDHPKIFIGAANLLNSKLWFHGLTILALFRALTELQSLKTKKDRIRTLADKAALNTTIKTAIEHIRKNYEI